MCALFHRVGEWLEQRVLVAAIPHQPLTCFGAIRGSSTKHQLVRQTDGTEPFGEVYATGFTGCVLGLAG